MATEKVNVIKIDSSEATTSVKSLRAELKQLKDVMLQTEEGTDEYNAALTKAANIQHTLREQTELTNNTAADAGQILSNTTKAVGGMVAGFQAATATMKLMGVENEDVLKSLEKMQSLMALTQSFSGIEQGIKSFKNLATTIQGVTGATSAWGKALISTGVGALVVALGYLIANFDEVSKWLDEVTGETDFFGKTVDKVTASFSAFTNSIIPALKAVGNAIYTYITAPFKTIAAAVETYLSTDGGITDKLKAAGKAGKDTFVNEWKEVGDDFKAVGTAAVEGWNKSLEESEKKRRDKEKEAALKALEEYRKRQQEQLDIRLEVLKRSGKSEEEMIQSQIKIEEERLKLYDKGTKAYEQQVTKIYELQQKLKENPLDALDNEMAKLKATTTDTKALLEGTLDIEQRRLELLKEGTTEYWNQLAVVNEVKDKLNNLNTESSSDGDIDKLQQWLDTQLFNYSNAYEQLDILEQEEMAKLQETLDNNLVTYEEYESLKTSIAQKYADERRNIQMDEMNVYASIGNGFADILSSIGSAMDESNEEQFKAAKAFNISAAIINTITGAIGAYTGAVSNAGINSIPVVGPALAMALGITNATAVGVAGAVQIAKIAKTKFGDKNTSGIGNMSAATPSVGAIGAINAPVQFTQDVQGASIQDSIADSRVYVVESDITNTQERVEVAESEARF